MDTNNAIIISFCVLFDRESLRRAKTGEYGETINIYNINFLC